MHKVSELMRSIDTVAFSQKESTMQLPCPTPNPAEFQLPWIPEEDETPGNPNANFLEPWPSW